MIIRAIAEEVNTDKILEVEIIIVAEEIIEVGTEVIMGEEIIEIITTEILKRDTKYKGKK